MAVRKTQQQKKLEAIAWRKEYAVLMKEWKKANKMAQKHANDKVKALGLLHDFVSKGKVDCTGPALRKFNRAIKILNS